MKRCAACGMFFDAAECPGGHGHIEVYMPPPQPAAKLCAACGYYFTEPECPRDHSGITVDNTLIALGSAVICDVTGIWSDLETIPGILVGKEGDEYRVLVALPGERGGTAAVTLPEERLSWRG